MILLLLILILLVTPTFGATLTDGTVAFYHGAPDRAGEYIVRGLNWRTAASVHRAQEFDGRVEGHIYASRCIGGRQVQDAASLSQQPRAILSMPLMQPLGVWSGALYLAIRCHDRRCPAAISIHSASPERQ